MPLTLRALTGVTIVVGSTFTFNLRGVEDCRLRIRFSSQPVDSADASDSLEQQRLVERNGNADSPPEISPTASPKASGMGAWRGQRHNLKVVAHPGAQASADRSSPSSDEHGRW